MPSGAWEGSARRKEKKRTFTGKISHVCVLYKKTTAMNILKTLICAALLVAGLSGWVTFTFDGNGNYQKHVYVLGGESHDYSGHYAIDLIDKGTITINPEMSDYSNVTYKLVKLTSKEMEWQKEGTTYSPGTWGSDYRHFVRGK